MNEREQRGLVIAAKSRIRKKAGLWSVPSQTGNGRRYTVNLTAGTCTCPDHQEAGHKCKHIFAVQYTVEREYSDDGTMMQTETLTIQTPRKTYQQDWRSYNCAQVNEKDKFQLLLRGLCDTIRPPKRGLGRPRIPLPDAIFAAVFKVYSTVSGRRFMSDLRDANEKGYVARLPSYNSIFRILEAETTSDVLYSLILESANPLKAIEINFACDSSGFSGCRFDRWFDQKWGEQRSMRAWVKAHVMTGVNTNVITAVEIHGQHSSDTVLFKPLLNTTATRFRIGEVSADMAYLSESNLQAVVDAGGTPLIPFKSNSVASRPGLWNKMYHYFQLNRDEFMARYHQRSNVESTFSMVKAKFGDSVRSKTDTAMKNEVLAKILCHNICCLISAMYELGLDPSFEAELQVAPKLAAS